MTHAVVLSGIPLRFAAGDSLSWRVSNSTFPAPDWSLSYTLVNADGQIQISAAAAGTDHLVEVTAAQSAAYAPGEYSYQCHVSKDDERYKLGEGVVTIGVNLATQAGGHDARSHVKKTLDALEAVIEGRASKTQQEHSVGGRQIQYIALSELTDLRDRYAVKYRKEQTAGCGGARRTLKPRFVN